MPPEIVKEVQSFTTMSMGRMYNPVLDKLKSEHLDKILDNSEKDGQRAYDDLGRSRGYTLTYVIIAIAIFVFLTIFLVGTDKELYMEILKTAIIFAGGFGGGFGIKTYLDKNY